MEQIKETAGCAEYVPVPVQRRGTQSNPESVVFRKIIYWTLQAMSAILGYLYLGGKSDAKDKEKLLKLKIKYILNCTPPRTLDRENGCSNYYEKEKTFVYKRIPIFDNKGEDIIAHMKTAYQFIEEGRHYGNVLVHCFKGVSRSASFVIGYLMQKNEFTFEEALSHVQMCRPVVQPNTAFIEQLKAYNPHSTGVAEQKEDNTPPIGPEVGPKIPNNECVVGEARCKSSDIAPMESLTENQPGTELSHELAEGPASKRVRI